MNRIEAILMKRDGLSELEAREAVNDAIAAIDEAIEYGAGIDEVEEIVRENLGLEPDYLDEILLGL